ncbi:MAG: malate/citrate symporter [Candidatus Phytoplasma cynodontis]|uniref:2-hydroxycarboxylate transporter family protein n=1 Tax='Cynodon dactylon' phytoplasma TaxID=295320 RepID=UPI001265B2C4|nr:2-hydroxycarboxylate transporter family protein ['Cynodon dactylon' phytoplasma]KAB8122023.1 malate:citrate symporter ['Cynodon dactylon' phytoplasma]WIA07560.1 MAG: malate/citrate symporter [Candidatus Phytoplasma cynodontis]
MKKNQKKEILGLPIVTVIIILLISIINIAISYNYKNSSFDKSFHNIISTIVFAMSIGAVFKIVGEKVPILKDIGGGATLCLLVPAFIFNYQFTNFGNEFIKFQNAFKEKAKFLNSNYINNGNGIGFSDFFVAGLVAGSLLSIPKCLIKKTLKKFLPLVLISLTISATIVAILGFLFQPIKGIDAIPGCNAGGWANAIFFIFVPISSGGITCGIVPLTQVFSQGNSNYVDLYRSHIISSLLIGGIASIMFSGLIKKFFGNSKYNSKEGTLEKYTEKENQKQTTILKENKTKIISDENNISNITTGLFLTFGLYTLSNIFKNLLSLISPSIKNYIPPTIVFLVMLIMFLKIFDLISNYYTNCIQKSSELITKTFSSAILVIVGIGTDINKIISSLSNISFLLTCLTCVLTTALAAAIIGNKIGYYPVQSSIAAGLCANSIGGAGNLAILEASSEPKLLPYAQISTRLGGDIIVIIASILFPIIFNQLPLTIK